METTKSRRNSDPGTDERRAHAQSCVLHFPSLLTIHPGQSHPHILLLKAMLQALQEPIPELNCPVVSPTLDPNTEACLKVIQRCSGLPETGILDKVTWNRVCRLYRALFDRYHAPSQG